MAFVLRSFGNRMHNLGLVRSQSTQNEIWFLHDDDDDGVLSKSNLKYLCADSAEFVFRFLPSSLSGEISISNQKSNDLLTHFKLCEL